MDRLLRIVLSLLSSIIIAVSSSTSWNATVLRERNATDDWRDTWGTNKKGVTFLNVTDSVDKDLNDTEKENSFAVAGDAVETVVTPVFLGVRAGKSKVDTQIPAQWTDFCKVTDNLECLDTSTKSFVVDIMKRQKPVCVICNVEPENEWNLYALREFLHMPSVSKNYAISIKCHNNGNITLPWPMRADGLKYLSVDNCVIIDPMKEYLNSDVSLIPDTIVYYSIVNSVLHVDIARFMQITPNMMSMSKAAKCGPEKELVMSVNRNISYSFSDIPVPLKKEIDQKLSKDTARDYHRGYSLSSNTCNYTKLVEIDRSISRSLGSKYDSMLVQNSVFPVLRVFNMSDVMLKELPERLDDWRLYFPRLKYLDFSHNNIRDFKSVIDYGMGTEDPSIGVIDLRYNNITTISLVELRRLQYHRFVKVDIRNNPFTCNCDMRDFVDFFRHKNNLTRAGAVGHYNYIQYLECQKPDNLKGRRIKDLTLSELGCETTTLLAAPIVILCIIVVFLIVFIIVIIKYRKEIVILAFTRLNILLPCQRIEDHAGKKYDAFVAYSRHDSNWVLNTLVPGLERPNAQDAFKLCLHQRDFAVGAAIAENIVQSVESSRHTILVISRRFLQSEWCLMEFRTAFHQSLLEKKKHLIIVTLEHIPPDELDADLKRCMQTLTYVNINDRLFWDKIIFSLTDKTKNKKNNRYLRNIRQAVGLGGKKKNQPPLGDNNNEDVNV